MLPAAKQQTTRTSQSGVPRVVSAPQLAGAGLDRAAAPPQKRLECWVYNRTFKTWCNGLMDKLPPPLQVAAKDCGVCHFMLLVKDPSSDVYHSFDFGPVGGDITLKSVELPDVADQQQGQASNRIMGAPGEIREVMLHTLPADAMYVGSTLHWDLDAIRRHNVQQPTHYKLHENDCRHYVNNLVRQMTGLEMATVQLLRFNFEQRMRSEQQARLHAMLGTLQLLAEQAQRLQQQDRAAGRSHGQGVAVASHHHSATATLTLSHLGAASHLQAATATPACSQAHAGAAGLHAAAPLLLHLLAGLPTWDAPLVTLGQVITHPNHWPAVSSIARAVMMGAGGVLAVKVVAATASAAAVAAPATAAAHAVAVTAAPALLPHTAAAAGRMSSLVAGKWSSFAPAARALALQLKTRAVQVAAPLVAMAHVHSSKAQLRLDTKTSNGKTTSVVEPAVTVAPTASARHTTSASASSLTEATKKRGPMGGLLPLPLRLPRPASFTSLMSSSGAVVPSSMLDSCATKTPSKPNMPGRAASHRSRAGAIVPAQARTSFWPTLMPRRKHPACSIPPPSPAFLPAATLQAAVMPQGPASPPAAITRSRLFPAFSRLNRKTSTAGQFAKLTWGAAARPTGLFKFACTPLTSWLASRRTAAGRPSSMVLLSPDAAHSVASTTSSPIRHARLWMWPKLSPTLALPSGEATEAASKDSEKVAAGTTLRQVVTPLESEPAVQQLLTGCNDAISGKWLLQPPISAVSTTSAGLSAVQPTQQANAISSRSAPSTTPVADCELHASCPVNNADAEAQQVTAQPLQHMPTLPAPTFRRKGLFKPQPCAATCGSSKPKHGLFERRRTGTAASNNSTVTGQSGQHSTWSQPPCTSPLAGLLAVLVTHMVQGQFQNALL